MGLNLSRGNMYGFVTHTWNTVKGKCEHDCSYCYVKRWKHQKEIRFDSAELKTNLGNDNFIFVGSSNDLFADNNNPEWVRLTLEHCSKFRNKYLFQSKNPANLFRYIDVLPENSLICTTIETNRYYPEIMVNSPKPELRALAMSKLDMLDRYVTIEPIMDFDLLILVDMIKSCSPVQVNIGADSGGHNLPEPSKENILALITELNNFTRVVEKKNLRRLLK
ncbi:MAG: hypothetical protein EPN82_09805 [Bacteroidetes bacterium]|nr:MAG: hypothetical protein EPN82_09805 [Bacteroidota bacterium]